MQGIRSVLQNIRFSHLPRLLFIGLAGSAITCAACTRSSVSLDHIETEVASFAPLDTVEATDVTSIAPFSGFYAVVWVTSDQPLIARNPAGLSGAAVGELPYSQGSLGLTGASTRLGSSNWVEVILPSGGAGWINSWNITEEVSSQDFCNDPRIPQIIDTFSQAVGERSGQKLVEVSNPERGLILRHNWWNPEIIFPVDTLMNIYQDLTEIDWGVHSGSEFPIQGSFQDIIAPQLEDVFSNSPELNCNTIQTGDTTREIVWPEEYFNINFYSVYRPVPEGGSVFDWRTWILGFEYIDGEPYITILVHYRGEI
jgi:hypothetical protein